MNTDNRYAHTLRIGAFLQECATFYIDLDAMTTRKVCSIAFTHSGNLFAGTSAGLTVYDVEENRFRRAEQSVPLTSIPVLIPDPAGGMVACSDEGVFHLDDSGRLSGLISSRSDIRQALLRIGSRHLILLASDALLDEEGKRLAPLPPGEAGKSLIELSNGSLIVGTDRGLYHIKEGTLSSVTSRSSRPVMQEGETLHALAADPYGGFWFANGFDLTLYQAGALQELTSEVCPPVADIRTLICAPDGSLWTGSPRGAARLMEGRWRRYAGRLWLPDDRVNAICIGPQGDAWIATDGGIARLSMTPMTPVRKAAHYERITQERHQREGYVTDCGLTRPGDLESALFHASDNDGLWTSLYLCAECFRFAVTGEAEARKLALQSLRALLELVRLTGIPGFPARAIIRKGEQVHQSDPGPNWYPSPVDPDVIYKDDTSSDEIDGHYMAWYVASELVADTELKAEIASVCRAVTDHILDHHYTLVGPTGKATRWGVWAPESLNFDPKWAAERGLNSLEILSHLKVALHLCPCERYELAYRSLIVEHHYALNTVAQKLTPPQGENNHSDDELAACAYYPLLLLEKDPALRRLYLLSLERTQAILRPEGSPFHNMIYGACAGWPCGAEEAAQWLWDCPLDLRDWTAINSDRDDLSYQAERDRFGQLQATRPLSPAESGAYRWNYNPYQTDRRGEGRSELDGAFWLLPYWMGRYHGILEED